MATEQDFLNSLNGPPKEEQDFLATLDVGGPSEKEQDFLDTLDDTAQTPLVGRTMTAHIPSPQMVPTHIATEEETYTGIESQNNRMMSAGLDPDRLTRQITDSMYFKHSNGVEVDPSALTNIDSHADQETKKELQSFNGMVAQHYSAGERAIKRNAIFSEMITRMDNGQSTADLEEKLAALPPIDPFRDPDNPLEKAAAFSAGQVPILVDLAMAGVKTGLTTGMLGVAGEMAATGGIGVPAAPATLVSFYGAGQIYGSGKRIWQTMEGAAYEEMLNTGIDEKVARKLARYGVGPVSAGLNILGLKYMRGLLPTRARKFLGDVTTGVIKKASKVFGVGKAVTAEVITENLEEANQMLLKEVAINITNEQRKIEGKAAIPGQTMQEVKDQLLEITEATFYATATIGSAAATITKAVEYTGGAKNREQAVLNSVNKVFEKTDEQTREMATESGAIILGVKEDEDGVVTEMLMADRKTGDIFETGPDPTAEEIFTKTGQLPQIDIDVDMVIETGDVEASLRIEKIRPEEEIKAAFESGDRTIPTLKKTLDHILSMTQDELISERDKSAEEFFESKVAEGSIELEEYEKAYKPIVTEINNRFPGLGIWFDGVSKDQEGKVQNYQFTMRQGLLNGLTFNVTDINIDALAKDVDNRIEKYQNEIVAAFEDERPLSKLEMMLRPKELHAFKGEIDVEVIDREAGIEGEERPFTGVEGARRRVAEEVREDEGLIADRRPTPATGDLREVEEVSRPASEIIIDINQAIGETGAIGEGFSHQEVNQLFTELAQNSWDQGIRTFKEFSSSVKESVGKAWNAIKDTVKQVWDSVVEFNKRLGETGAVGRDIKRMPEEVKQKLILRAETVKEIKTIAEQVRAAEEAGEGKLARSLRLKLIELIGRAKSEAATAQISTLTEKEKIQRRRRSISTIRDYFGMTDNDLKKISRKDVRLMSNYEFKKFKDEIQKRALEFSDTRQAKLELLNTIHELNLQKVDNFREALALPPIRDMSINQLRDFEELISEFHEGDTFLNKRQLETVDRTFLKGIRTWREAKEKIAEESGVPIEELDKIKTGLADNWRWDNALYESNPFYRVLVTRVNSAILDAEMKAHQIENEVFDLANKAQKSVKRTLAERAIPGDQQIFDYLEANKEAKKSLASQMTPEQLDLAHYMQEYFSQSLAYLIETKSLTRGRENYFVHMRRTLLEAVKEDGLITGVREMFKNYEMDEQAFNILDDNTGNILPLEKFFQFSLRRSGELVPTKNIVRAFTTYANTFEKKVALDGIIPAMSIYAQSLTPTVYTPRGLEIDQSIKKFVNKWINSKKGRKISYDSVVKQGGPLDLILNSTRMLVSVLKLGFSPIAQTAAPIGEQSANLIMMGVANQAKGTKRIATKKGKRIVEKYEGVVGRSVFETLTAPGLEVTDRLTSAMFAGFHAGSRVANAQYLLGMMTDQEYDSETISTKRLAELQLEKGRFRAVPGAESLVGATSSGKIGTQFKSWAIPVIRTTMKDLTKVTKDLKSKPFGEKLNSKEAAELLRITALTASVLAVYGIYQADDDDDSLLSKMINRVLSEASLIYSAFDVRWMLFTTPPAIKWAQDLGMMLADMIQLVEYKDGSGLRGPRRLVRHFTPGFIKPFLKKKKKPKY